MNNLPHKDNALDEASKFFSNYEKKYKPNTNVQPVLTFPERIVEKKERKKIVLETKARVFPSAAVITPRVFERQERSRPLIGSYKKEKIEYVFHDIFDGLAVKLQGNGDETEVVRVEEDEESRAVEGEEVRRQSRMSGRSSQSRKSNNVGREKKSDEGSPNSSFSNND